MGLSAGALIGAIGDKKGKESRDNSKKLEYTVPSTITNLGESMETKQPEPLSPAELAEMQAIQLKRMMINEEDRAFAHKLALNHGVKIEDYGKKWSIEGLVLMHIVEAEPVKNAEQTKSDESKAA